MRLLKRSRIDSLIWEHRWNHLSIAAGLKTSNSLLQGTSKRLRVLHCSSSRYRIVSSLLLVHRVGLGRVARRVPSSIYHISKTNPYQMSSTMRSQKTQLKSEFKKDCTALTKEVFDPVIVASQLELRWHWAKAPLSRKKQSKNNLKWSHLACSRDYRPPSPANASTWTCQLEPLTTEC